MMRRRPWSSARFKTEADKYTATPGGRGQHRHDHGSGAFPIRCALFESIQTTHESLQLRVGLYDGHIELQNRVECDRQCETWSVCMGEAIHLFAIMQRSPHHAEVIHVYRRECVCFIRTNESRCVVDL